MVSSMNPTVQKPNSTENMFCQRLEQMLNQRDAL